MASPALVSGRAAPESFADLADKVSSSVVNITTSAMIAAPTGKRPMVPKGSPFEDFFREFMDPNNQGQVKPRHSDALGSGFVISNDGYIITNNHVIEGADEIEIEFFSGEKLPAVLVGTDPKTDIAVLKVKSDEKFSSVAFGDSDVMRVGDWVMAVGNPLGQGFSVTAGIVSARNRELSGTYDDFLQTDAAINRGNSGGPLFNMDGEVIGVNTAILSPNGGSIGIGFSMASNVVAKVVDQLIEFGETRRGWLGVRIQNVDADVAEAMGLASLSGALITDVPKGPARDAGFQSGDVILSFDEKTVEDSGALVRLVADAPVGKAVDVVVQRGSEQVTLAVVLGRREEAEAAVTPAAAEQDTPLKPASALIFGMTLETLSPESAASAGLAVGSYGLLVVDIDEASEAFYKGLRVGDVLVEARQMPLTSSKDLEDRIQEAKEAGRKSLLLLIRRDGNPRFLALSLDQK
ncbi:MAG: Do family serine endopeptidase [Paracoccaceae bacterium]